MKTPEEDKSNIKPRMASENINENTDIRRDFNMCGDLFKKVSNWKIKK